MFCVHVPSDEKTRGRGSGREIYHFPSAGARKCIAQYMASSFEEKNTYQNLEASEEVEAGASLRRPSALSAASVAGSGWKRGAWEAHLPYSPRSMAVLLLAPILLLSAWAFFSLALTAVDERDFAGRIVATELALRMWRLEQRARFDAQHCDDFGEIVNNPGLAGECSKRKATYYHKGPMRDAFVAREAAAHRHDCGWRAGYRKAACTEEFRVAASAFSEAGYLSRLQVPLLLWLAVSSRRVAVAAAVALTFFAAWHWRAYMLVRADPKRAPRGGVEADAACLVSGEAARRDFSKYD